MKDKRKRIRCKLCKKRVNLVFTTRKKEKIIGKKKHIEILKLFTCPNCLGQMEVKKLVIQDLNT
jgi:transcription elongation factor Elf1